MKTRDERFNVGEARSLSVAELRRLLRDEILKGADRIPVADDYWFHSFVRILNGLQRNEQRWMAREGFAELTRLDQIS